MNKEEYIFPTDCSKENIQYLLDIGCRVVVTITYKKFWHCKNHINTCELKYYTTFKDNSDEDFMRTKILDMSPTTPEYFWDHYEFPLYINRNDLL